MKREQYDFLQHQLESIQLPSEIQSNTSIDYYLSLIQEQKLLSVDSIIFHSEQHPWKSTNSVVDEILFNQSNLFFLIETKKNRFIGGYFHNKITKLNSYLRDKNAFLCSFLDNGIRFYPIHEQKSDKAFQLASNESKEIFRFGSDLICLKQGFPSRCNQSSSSSYNYGTYSQALLGSLGSFRINTFIIYKMK